MSNNRSRNPVVGDLARMAASAPLPTPTPATAAPLPTIASELATVATDIRERQLASNVRDTAAVLAGEKPHDGIQTTLDDGSTVAGVTGNPIAALLGTAKFVLASGKVYDDKFVVGKTNTAVAHAIFNLAGMELTCSISMESVPVQESDGTYLEHGLRMSMPKALTIHRDRPDVQLQWNAYRDAVLDQYEHWAAANGATAAATKPNNGGVRKIGRTPYVAPKPGATANLVTPAGKTVATAPATPTA